MQSLSSQQSWQPFFIASIYIAELLYVIDEPFDNIAFRWKYDVIAYSIRFSRFCLRRGKIMISLVFADKHKATRAGLRTILSEASDIKIVGEAKDFIAAQKFSKSQVY